MHCDNASAERVRLSAGEKALAVHYHPSISTVTFFDGEPPSAFLRERVAAVVSANCWLVAGWQKGTHGCEIVVPSEVPSTTQTQCYTEVSIPGFHREMDMQSEMMPTLGPLLVKTGWKALSPGEMPFKVVLVRANHSAFALVVSMSASRRFEPIGGVMLC